MSDNPYNILGVNKDANAADIKKAFRAKAKTHHPDKGGNEAEFKKINQAYEILGDQQKRAQYDQFGSTGGQGGFGGGSGGAAQGFGGFNAQDFGGGFEDIFSSFFGGSQGGGSRNPHAPQKGSDLEVEAQISFAESVTGVTKQFRARRYKACDKCEQKGGSGQSPCGTCNGSGQTAQRFQTPFGTVQQQTACATCHGSGQTFKDLCTECHGDTRFEEKTNIEVNIPAGIQDGQTVRMRDEGDSGKFGGPYGDFFVHVRVATDKNWQREGLDLVSEMEVPIFATIGGTEVRVKTFWGQEKLTIPELTADNTRLKIKGQGIKRDGQVGDHVVVIKHKLPRKISKKLADLLKQAGKES